MNVILNIRKMKKYRGSVFAGAAALVRKIEEGGTL